VANDKRRHGSYAQPQGLVAVVGQPGICLWVANKGFGLVGVKAGTFRYGQQNLQVANVLILFEVSFENSLVKRNKKALLFGIFVYFKAVAGVIKRAGVYLNPKNSYEFFARRADELQNSVKQHVMHKT